MSKRSEHVKNWRKNTKNRIVEAMGGKCICCGYNKCNSALSLHHLDPSQKEFQFGKIRANPASWLKIVEELKKCVLLCNNCHAEFHDGLIKIPEHHASFNESFSYYKDLENKSNLDNCKICGKLKPKFKITCSISCAGKCNHQINWNIINLKSELESKSITQIAEELNCSNASVRNRIKRIGL
jgi:hypothetical protein